MKLDKPDHQKFLLELLIAASFPGQLIDLAYEIKKAVENAEVDNPKEPT